MALAFEDIFNVGGQSGIVFRKPVIVGSVAASPTISSGTGAPAFTAPQGSLYLRLDGSSTSTRLYVNTTGSTTWTNFTSAA